MLLLLFVIIVINVICCFFRFMFCKYKTYLFFQLFFSMGGGGVALEDLKRLSYLAYDTFFEAGDVCVHF